MVSSCCTNTESGSPTVSTTYGKAAALRQFLAWLEGLGGPRTLLTAVGKARCPRPRQIVATAAEVAALGSTGPLWLRLFVMLIHDEAMRFAEAWKLSPANYNPETRTVSFRKKGGDTHTLPVSPQIAAILESLPDTDAEKIPYIDHLRGSPITRQQLHRRFHKLVLQVGANPALTPHDLRRTRITSLYTQTKDLRVCQQLAGHTQMWTTARYVAHLDAMALNDVLHSARPYTAREKETPQ